MMERTAKPGAVPPAWSAVVVAAGRGSRMGTDEPKQYLGLAGKPILLYALELFEAMPEIGEIVLVAAADEIGRCEALCRERRLRKVRRIVAGGAERQQSVYRGIGAASGEWVLVHDAVRPLVTADAVRRCMARALETGAAVLAVPVKDTIKVVDEAGRIAATPERRALRAVQTPQAFRRELLLACHERAAREGFAATDDAMVVERFGHPVAVAEGEYSNIKITTPDDLAAAEWLLRTRRSEAAAAAFAGASAGGTAAGGTEGADGMFRIGQGFDVHAFAEGRPLVIGGVTIPHERGLLGHSDADVLLHAIADAVLGALGLGDIGKHFPDTDPKYKDADSAKLLGHVWLLAKERGYRLGNVDATIIAQRPKMAPHIPRMVETIARVLEADDPSRVNVKATTTERLGFTGREEGIAAQAVVCLVKREQQA
jgi:2-C-methyl-D-erythritol 4-phosphate cytidylyltransferase/2-C-methyl-D-erythritol 4-phosphate cytidylyltransferase/2-C-methyl-D-erythritol 2,4-cyclodiphosphate synthase